MLAPLRSIGRACVAVAATVALAGCGASSETTREVSTTEADPMAGAQSKVAADDQDASQDAPPAELELDAARRAAMHGAVGHGHGHEHGHGDAGKLGHGHHDKRFEDAAKWAERFDSPERDAWQKPEEVVAAMAIEPGMRVVDIGAGTGYFLPHLSAAAGADGTIEGLDLEPAMVEWMTERIEREGLANASARVVEGGDPGLEPGSVDRILIVNTWHHIPDRTTYAATLAKGLAEGGELYLVEYHPDADQGPPPEHRLAPEVLVEELAAGGFDADVLELELPRQYMVRARRAE